MKNISLIFLFAFVPQILVGQIFGELIEQNIQSTVLINIGSTSGSGILVHDSTSIYLITAKHVLFNQTKNELALIDSQFVIKFYGEDLVKEKQNLFVINAALLLRDSNLLYHTEMDICVAKLGIYEQSEPSIQKRSIRYLNGVTRPGKSLIYRLYPLIEGRFLKKKDLYLGELIFTVGFPISLGLKDIPQFDYEKPLLKRCSIAGLSQKYQTYIIDCHVYAGNSGGPVFLERTDFNSYSIKLIGIAVEYIPFLNNSLAHNDVIIQTSSYAVIVPIEYAMELMEHIK